MVFEESVAAHYGRVDAGAQLLGMLRREGKDPEHFVPADLHGADQLHIGGPGATARLAERAGIGSGIRVLDIGSGMGGVARHLAHEYGVEVHGVDLTPEFVELSRSLTQRTGLAGSVTFSQGSALALPLEDSSFDAAVIIHVGMNIRDKDQVFAEASRVLRPGGVIAVYDIMVLGGEPEDYPLPWANTAETSFVQPPLAYSDALAQAGFEVDLESKTVQEGIDFIDRAINAGPGRGGPVGVDAAALGNLRTAFQAGVLGPVEIYAHLPG